MILCVGRNYQKHVQELENQPPAEPVLFMKAECSRRLFNDYGSLAVCSEPIHFESEIVLEIGRVTKLGEKGRWNMVSHLRGGLDLTLRGKQTELKEKGLPWVRAKSFVGAAILSPSVDLAHFPNLEAIGFRFELNGRLRQKGNTKDMIFKVEHLLSDICKTHTLNPGDLIFTGTPEGVGTIKSHDEFIFKFDDVEERFEGKL